MVQSFAELKNPALMLFHDLPQTVCFCLWHQAPASFHSFIFRHFLYQPFLTDLASACMSSPFVANIVFSSENFNPLKNRVYGSHGFTFSCTWVMSLCVFHLFPALLSILTLANTWTKQHLYNKTNKKPH